MFFKNTDSRGYQLTWYCIQSVNESLHLMNSTVNNKTQTHDKPSVYKSLFLEIDSSKLKDRVEWCHVGYHGNYNPDMAFEIELQWLTSTPSLLHELVSFKLHF